MKEIRNSQGKLVCCLDETNGIVEIAHKGCKTLIHFKPDGTVVIINTGKVV